MLANSRPLPANPSLEQLRKQAKEFRNRVRTGDLKTIKMARELHPRWAGATEWAGFILADAQLVVARSYGFPSWRRLRDHLDLLARYPHRHTAGGADPVDEFLWLACLTAMGLTICGDRPKPATCWPSTRSWPRPPSTPPRRSATSPPPGRCWPRTSA